MQRLCAAKPKLRPMSMQSLAWFVPAQPDVSCVCLTTSHLMHCCLLAVDITARVHRSSFFSTGMSCGGVITLSRLGSGYEVRVNWLTGGVEIVPFNPT